MAFLNDDDCEERFVEQDDPREIAADRAYDEFRDSCMEYGIDHRKPGALSALKDAIYGDRYDAALEAEIAGELASEAELERKHTALMKQIADRGIGACGHCGEAVTVDERGRLHPHRHPFIMQRCPHAGCEAELIKAVS